MSQIIKKPLVTEKNNLLMEKGIYVFKVSRQANKTLIKKHIETYFQVKTAGIRTSVCRKRGKRTKSGPGRVKYWKKAFIRLQAGEKITVFEGN